MSHEAGNRRGLGEGNGNKTKISLKWEISGAGSVVMEKRLFELGEGVGGSEWEWEWEGGGEKRIKNGRERGMIEKVEEGKADGDSCNSVVSLRLKGDANSANQSIVTLGFPVALSHKGKSRGIGNTKSGVCKRNTVAAAWAASVSQNGWSFVIFPSQTAPIHPSHGCSPA